MGERERGRGRGREGERIWRISKGSNKFMEGKREDLRVIHCQFYQRGREMVNSFNIICQLQMSEGWGEMIKWLRECCKAQLFKLDWKIIKVVKIFVGSKSEGC